MFWFVLDPLEMDLPKQLASVRARPGWMIPNLGVTTSLNRNSAHRTPVLSSIEWCWGSSEHSESFLLDIYIIFIFSGYYFTGYDLLKLT
jgi:hypothetical protein